MTISGNATVCGVIGNPVGHSLSPMMQNYFAKKLDLDFAYVPCNVPDQQVGEAVKGIYALGFKGINVTIPHKQRVMPYLLEIDEAARCIGAVNTLVVWKAVIKDTIRMQTGFTEPLPGRRLMLPGRIAFFLEREARPRQCLI